MLHAGLTDVVTGIEIRRTNRLLRKIRMGIKKGGRSLPFSDFVVRGTYVLCGAGGTPTGPLPPETGTDEVGPSVGFAGSPRSRIGGSPLSRF